MRDDHLIVGLASIFNQYHVDLPDADLVHVLILIFFHEGRDLPQELIETDRIYKETLVETIYLGLREA